MTMIARVVHDVSVRVVYPFLPEVSAGLRMPLDRVGQMLSLRSGVEILSPLAGALSDRIGHRRSMSIALAVLAFGLAIIGLAEGPTAAALGFVVSGTVLTKLFSISLNLQLKVYPGFVVFAIIMSVLSSLYPAIKAAKLNPVEALRAL